MSLDGRLVAVGGRSGVATVLDVATGDTCKTLSGHTGDVWVSAFSLDGQRLATAGMDCTIRLWDLATGQSLSHSAGHTGSVDCVLFNSDGSQLVSASEGTKRSGSGMCPLEAAHDLLSCQP